LKKKLLHRASWKSGFARNASESTNPQIWNGLAGYWAPSLGCTGIKRLVDISGKYHNGTINGSMTLADWIVSEMGYVLDFDGSNDYIDLGNPSDLDFGTGDFTIAMWVNPDSLTSPAELQLFMAKDVSGGRDWTFGMGSYAQGELTFISVNPADVEACASTSAVMTVNEWQHVVVVYRSGSVPVLYRNGVALATDNPASGDDSWAADFNTSTTVAMGRREFVGFEQEFNGQIGDSRVYNRALSADEVRELYWFPQAGLELRTTKYRAPVITAGSPWYYYAQQ